MNALRVVRQIDSNNIHIDGLDRHKGKKAEIIILIEDGTEGDISRRIESVYSVINAFTGSVRKWKREDLYD